METCAGPANNSDCFLKVTEIFVFTLEGYTFAFISIYKHRGLV